MQAAYITGLGPPAVIHVGHLPAPNPGPTDVLVRVELVAVDPVDTFVRSGAYPTPTPFPFVIGRDLVGTVAEAGPGVTSFAPGDRVWANSLGHGGRQGPSSELAVVAADRLYHLPDGVDPAAAVALAHPAATAALGLHQHGRLRAGETVFLGGGAGNVGRAAIAMAATAGARVVASARADDWDRCRTAGATAMVDFTEPNMAAHLGAAAPEGIDLYWDTSGHHDLGTALSVLALGGRVLVTAGLRAPIAFPAGELYTRDAALVGFAISTASVDQLGEAARHVNDGLRAGRFDPGIAEVWPLERAAEAHEAIERGDLSGSRLLLRV